MGPESAVAILVATILAPMAGGDIDRYIALAAAMSLMIGVVCVFGALLRLGVITRLLSRPVLDGYIFGSAVLIVISQLDDLFGIKLDKAEYYSDLGAIQRNIELTNPLALGLGSSQSRLSWYCGSSRRRHLRT